MSLIGANGAGKTTTLKGDHRVAAGGRRSDIEFLGRSLKGRRLGPRKQGPGDGARKGAACSRA